MEYKLSPSNLNLLEDCPRCFWLQMVNNIKRPRGPISSLPIKMDSIIKNYFNKYRGTDQLPPILNGNISGRLAINMPKTLKYELDKEFTLWGRPDNYVVLDNSDVIAMDHKTRSDAPDKIHPAYQLQLEVYSFLLRALGYNTISKALLLFYYPDECDLHNGLPFNCKIFEVKTNPFFVYCLLKKARNVLNGYIPDFGRNCSYCK